MNKKAVKKISGLFAKARSSTEGKKCDGCAYCCKTSTFNACELYGFIMNGCAPVKVDYPHNAACGLYSETAEIDVDKLIASCF